MREKKTIDLLIVGGGPAGLAAAIAAKKQGIDDLLIVERDDQLGGILGQCIHSGFGLHTFREELTGPEYAHRFITQAEELGITALTESMVLDITPEKKVTVISRAGGLQEFSAKSIVLAMGCRERPRGSLNIPGYRPMGIYSAGTAQRLVNVEGFLPGKEVVILGSGDIGLIMARRMTLEGAKVKVVAELMPYSGGLKRNIVQCLDDFGIPLKLRHTVIDMKGKHHLEGVTLAQVDERGKPVPGTEEYYSCDTLLLSCGLIPENELSREMGVDMNPVTGGPVVDDSLETSIPGVFACGNVLHVHDLVDFVSEEAAQAGEQAAKYIRGGQSGGQKNRERRESLTLLRTGEGVRYTVPAMIDRNRMRDEVKVRFRVSGVYRDCEISIYAGSVRILRRKKQIVTPGEMEEVILTRAGLEEAGWPEEIHIVIEEKDGAER